MANGRKMSKKDIYILGIETSCDETAASVVKNGRDVLSNIISSRKGDANGDNEVNITDVIVIVDYILNRPIRIFLFSNADMDKNGEVNITDALKVVDIILGRP